MNRGFAQGIGTGAFSNTRVAKAMGRAIDKALGWVLTGAAVIVLVAVNWFLSRPVWERTLIVVGIVLFIAWRLDRRWTQGRGLAAIRGYRPRTGQEVRTAVYRFYDELGALMYVGIAVDPDRRREQHAADPKKRHWWWRVDRREVEWFDSREEAKDEETAWITGQRGPRPYFNVAENQDAA